MFHKIAFCGFALIGLFAADDSAAVAMSPASNPRQRDIFLKIPLKDQKAAPIRIADAGARPDGVRLTTSWPTPTINQGETIINTLDVYNAVAGQKIRIQNSNHGASYFTTNFDAAIQATGRSRHCPGRHLYARQCSTNGNHSRGRHVQNTDHPDRHAAS
jgi:hypothetical protein